MAWQLARSLIQLRLEIHAVYPTRSIKSDGSIGDANHSARTSDHNPDDDGDVCAIDVTQDDANNTPRNPHDDVAEALAEYLRASRDPRIKYVIWRGRMFSSYATKTRKAWEWGPYSGPNGHFHHCHISVNQAGKNDPRPWGFRAAKQPTFDPNRGRQWHQFSAGATDGGLYRKGYRNDGIAEYQILMGLPVTHTMDPRTIAATVALKNLAGWPITQKEPGSLVNAKFMQAVRALNAQRSN